MILCCGEALIDMIPAPTTSGEQGFVPHVGGAIFNTAITLGRLGSTAGMFTGLSRDLFGRQLQATLSESGVETDMVLLSDRPTTLAFVHLIDGQATYTFYDENSAGRGVTAEDLPSLPDAVTALFFGGISLCSLPAADAYAALATSAGAERGIMMDPNIRPGFTRDEAAYRARLDRMFAVCDIVKVSVEDLDWLYDTSEDALAKAERLRAAGPGIVVLTKGSAGAVGLMADQPPCEVPAVAADVVDTVAAGDTFNGALLSWLDGQGLLTKSRVASLAPDDLRQALAFAARAAAITVSRAGANPPWAAEMSQDP